MKKKKTYPMFICPHCGFKVKLTFNIKSRYNRSKWDEFICSKCGKRNIEDDSLTKPAKINII